ncbi:TPA: hypothetical protein HA351_02155 [Methanosarcinaceae archaeon]|nr:hypothetical protein [Methanosarcinaceae archaeon]
MSLVDFLGQRLEIKMPEIGFSRACFHKKWRRCITDLLYFAGWLLPHSPIYHSLKFEPQKPRPVFLKNDEVAFPGPDHIAIPVPQLFRLPGVEID